MIIKNRLGMLLKKLRLKQERKIKKLLLLKKNYKFKLILQVRICQKDKHYKI